MVIPKALKRSLLFFAVIAFGSFLTSVVDQFMGFNYIATGHELKIHDLLVMFKGSLAMGVLFWFIQSDREVELKAMRKSIQQANQHIADAKKVIDSYAHSKEKNPKDTARPYRNHFFFD